MRARLVISYLVLVFVALGLFTIPVAISSAQLLRSTLQDTALREARLFAPLVLRQDAAAAVSIADRTRDFQQATGSRVRLVRSGDPAPDDAQVTAALDGGDPVAVWGPNALLGAEAVSVVLPVRDGSRVVAAVQIVAPSQQVDDQIRGIWIFRLGVGLGVLAASAGIAILLAGSVVRPLRRLESVARRLGQGDWSARAEEDGPPEVAALARTLNGSARTTEALLASQRSFVADASHQLRTPLTSVRLSLDNLRDSADDDPVLVRQLTRVEGEIDRMGRMVEGLLTLARAESSAAPSQSVDLAAVVADRADVWTPALDAAAVHLAVVVPEPCPVLVTPGACEQVLDNLVDNALAVVPRGSTVTIGARRVGGDVRLVVRDQGPGLSDEQRARAFDRFWRAGPAGTGSGLGLAIVRRLVEHDGGAVTLEAAPGGGLCVVVLLRAFT